MSQAHPPLTTDPAVRLRALLAWGLAGAAILFLFTFFPAFSERSGSTAFAWLRSTWNERNHLEHGYLLPPIACWLVWRQRREIDWQAPRPQLAGLLVVALGALLFIASMRVLQQRVAIASFPFFVTGTALYLGGARAARHFLFPSCLIYFVVPIPGLLQATNGLQLVATAGAHRLAELGGAAVARAGNYLSSETGSWGFDVAEGCSGIRSLMILTLTAAIVGHLSQDRLWKKLLLLASALPLAVVANALRVASVVLLAEHVNADFAATLYHDYSTLVFYPIALGLLLAVARLLRGRWWRRAQRRVVRRELGGPRVAGKEALES